MSISYPFTPFNSIFKKNMLQSKVTLREYKVWDGVSYLAYSFPETRDTLTITTTCRQIGELICLPFQHVATALQKLARRGFITILKKGFWGKDGEREPSIIQLNPVTNLVTHGNDNNKQINKLVTHQVTKLVTPPSNQNSDTPKRNIEKKHDMHVNASFINSDSNFPTKEKTKQPVTTMSTYIDKESIPITFIKDENKQQEKASFKFTMGAGGFNNTVDNDACNKQSEERELSSLASILASVPIPQVKEQPQVVNITQITTAPMPAVTTPAVAGNSELTSMGVQEKAFYIGMNELKKRNISDIPGSLTALGTILKGKKNIQNPSGYFVKLCKEVSLENLFKPVPASVCENTASAALPIQKKNTFTEIVNRWEEEKKTDSPEDIFKKLMALRPDDLYKVVLDVDTSPAGKFVSLPEIKASLYVNEFKKRFPEVTV